MIALFLANLRYRWHDYRNRRAVVYVNLKLVNQ